MHAFGTHLLHPYDIIGPGCTMINEMGGAMWWVRPQHRQPQDMGGGIDSKL